MYLPAVYPHNIDLAERALAFASNVGSMSIPIEVRLEHASAYYYDTTGLADMNSVIKGTTIFCTSSIRLKSRADVHDWHVDKEVEVYKHADIFSLSD